MSQCDPIADMLTRVRNAHAATKEECSLPFSRMKESIAKILSDEGYISSYRVEGEGAIKTLVLTLKYFNGDQPAIRGLERVSKQGLRQFSSCDDLPRVLNGMGVAIVTTSKGVMTDRSARKNRVGGEVMAYVW